MSKRKYARKRQHAKESVKQKITPPNIPSGESGNAKNKRDSAKNSNQEGDAKKEAPVIPNIFKSSFTDWCLAIFTAALTVTAFYQYVISDRQLSVMRNDERSWIETNTTSDFTSLVAGQPIVDMVSLMNVGKTPAIMVEMTAYIEVVPASAEPHLGCVETPAKCLPPNRSTVGILFPNTKYEANIERAVNWPASSQEYSDWNEGVAYVAVYGIAKYTDVFHVQHWTKFCFRRNRAPLADKNMVFNARQCAEFNSADTEDH